jgi:pimeloyl-ACP methyl ester carboxylesterase
MRLTFYLVILLIFTSCQKVEITSSRKVSEAFYVENAGASMRVLVEGNTAGNTFILVIHGGPGAGSYIYNTDYISDHLENNFAMVYWDQRNSGASQGNSNGKNLNLNQMVDDLKKVIEVLKFRYGQDMSLFLLGHSFGGLIAADFLTRPGSQDMIKGLINVDGSHNYPLNDTLSREMLLSMGKYQISKNRNEEKWEKIISYCDEHTGNFTLEESQQIEKYASNAEGYIDSVNKIHLPAAIIKNSISDKSPLTSILVNLLYSEDSDFNLELSKSQFTTKLGSIAVPVLVLWGKYDFVCPQPLGEDFYNHISSAEKSFVISPVSGHNLMLQDGKLFCDEVNSFVLKYR